MCCVEDLAQKDVINTIRRTADWGFVGDVEIDVPTAAGSRRWWFSAGRSCAACSGASDDLIVPWGSISRR
jgi:sporulation protein YlmC with PRC-barrel domain